jgi:hypothetical protein
LSDFTNVFSLQPDSEKLETFGLKLTGGGPHIGRTILLEQITRLLRVAPPNATLDQYKIAVIEQNALGKATQANGKETFRRLRELYGLSGEIPLFSIYRELLTFDSESAPLLSFLVAWARDPLFRATSPAIFDAGPGSGVSKHNLERSLLESYPDDHSPLSIAKIARYASSSWTQSGHLIGHTKKIRTRVQPRPASLTLALLLACVCGSTGESLFTSPWCRLLDLSGSEAKSLASQAHREGLIDLKVVGSIVDISFPRFGRMLEGSI